MWIQPGRIALGDGEFGYDVPDLGDRNDPQTLTRHRNVRGKSDYYLAIAQSARVDLANAVVCEYSAGTQLATKKSPDARFFPCG